MQRVQVPAPGPVGEILAYSSAVRVGPHVWISGAAPYDDDGRLVGDGNPYEQARQALVNLGTALSGVGARLADVVATRIYVLDVKAWREIGRAHGDTFREVQPASTMVEVHGLLGPGMVVEIEAEAFVCDQTA